jgi:uncharacterized protein (TIGR03663 family)
MDLNSENKNTWLSAPVKSSKFSYFKLFFLLIMIVTIFSRFYDLESRVMSHDESLHTYFSWQLYKGNGFEHTPLMHGPFQFHLLSWTYTLFGDNDFTARIPAVIFSILSVAFVWNFKRYLGKTSTLITALLMAASPFMLYYGRYVRNDSFSILFGIISFWALLRYLDTGTNKYLYYLTIVTALHFTTKETSFIYLAQMLIFLGILFIRDLYQRNWKSNSNKKVFFNLLLLSGVFLTMAVTGYFWTSEATPIDSISETIPVLADANVSDVAVQEPSAEGFNFKLISLSLVVLALISFVIAFINMVLGYGNKNLKRNRIFGVMVLYLTMVLPHLSALFINFLSPWDSMDYSTPLALGRIAIFIIPLFIIAGLAGKWWNWKEWLINQGIFYSIFILFFTTFFTNGIGFFTGLVGSLGYWLIQQGVERGSQPIYYYLLVQLPVYEFLPIIGTIIAAVFGWRKRIPANDYKNKEIEPFSSADQTIEDESFTYISDGQELTPYVSKNNAKLLFWFWAISSILAYSFAGEKMPWLTIHISLPLIFLGGSGIGNLIKSIDWEKWQNSNGWGLFFGIPIFLFTIVKTLSAVFSLGALDELGKTTTQLNSFNIMISGILFTIFAGNYLVKQSRKWNYTQVIKIFALFIVFTFFLQTVKASVMATYINYDQAREYLVYAHGARGVKDVMEQVESISRRTTDGLALNVAFDNDVSWPMTWYLRNYTNQVYYGESPTKDLRNSPVIIVGDNNFLALEPIVGQGYHEFEYIRMWWPNQDYFNLSIDKIKQYFSSPDIINGLFQIWLNRDYEAYGIAMEKDFSLPNWSPSDKMRLYIRKDIVSDLWDYGVSPGKAEIVIDPYENNSVFIPIDAVIGLDAQLNGPRDIAIAPDGTIFATDSRNHRIVHFAPTGEIINQWGSPSILNDSGNSPSSTFNEPWGIAVSNDGEYVYVADTWNHRIQKFTSDGVLVNNWGYFEQIEDPFAFWGPRDVAIGPNGNVFVSNTGNKRIVVFTPEGEYVTQFGEIGFSPGQFDEPVGIAIDHNSGNVFVADTWNQRIQVFAPDGFGNYLPYLNWEISGWYGNTLENKPYITIDDNNHLYVGDPELSRILIFTLEGEFVKLIADENLSLIYGYPMGIAADENGDLWIADSKENRIIHLDLP